MSNQLIPHRAKGNVMVALADTRSVAIQGARQTGKSTFAKQIASECSASYLSLGNTSVRSSWDTANIDTLSVITGIPDKEKLISSLKTMPAKSYLWK